MRIRFERESEIERVVIDLVAGRVRIEGATPEPLLDAPLDKVLLAALKEWLAAQDGVKELKDEQA